MRMKMNSTTTMCVFLLILVLLEMICCQGCWKHEREALLALKAQFDSPLPWGDNADCCKWDCVECNTTTRRVEELYLTFVMDYDRPGNWYVNYSDFLVFEDLKSLYLSKNSIAGCVGHEGLRLSNLEVIDLSFNLLNNTESILSCLDGLSSLKSLDLSDNGFNGASLHGLKLSNLEVLGLSYNLLNNTESILSCLDGLSSLKSLDLSFNGFNGTSVLHALSSKLLSLEVLDIGGNDFNGSDVPSSLGGLQHLKHLGLSYTQLEGSLNISALLGLSNLESLNLRGNDISNFVVHQGSKSLSKLEVLNLAGNKMDGNMLRKSLRAFSSIRELDLSTNEFKGTIVAADFHDLSNLENLVLDGSNLINEFFKSIGLLTSLRVLSMTGCNINGTLLATDWSMLKKLEELDLRGNGFEGPLPSSFCNMTSLLTLDLSRSHFTGNLGSNIGCLTSLEYLAFDENQFEVPISFTPFANHSNIKVIRGSGNKVILDSHPTLQTWVPNFQLQVLDLSYSTIETKSIPFPNFLLYQYNLSYLDFTGWKLEGEFPNCLLENNTKMTELFLKNCSFTGTFKLPSRPLLSRMSIDVSHNAISGQIPSNNISSIFPNLEYLDMSVNDIHGSIPHEFGQMNSLVILDLSDNHLFGEIPKNISGCSRLDDLRLSNNKLDVGTVFPILSMLNNLRVLVLDGNSFSGSVPSSSFNNISSSLSLLDLSNNDFVGKLPSGWNQSLSSLTVVSMSNNRFEGSIPSELAQLESLEYLDLSLNKLTGFVPSFSSSSMKSIHLSNNKLSDLPKRMLNESFDLWILDLNNNHITSGIQDMIHVLMGTSLEILLLKGNHFTGQIPKQLCQLINITILDLSHNNFYGPIPNCLGKMPFANDDLSDLKKLLLEDRIYGVSFSVRSSFLLTYWKASFTTKKSIYTYTASILVYMTGFDLSFNKLNGKIPSEFGNLTKIRAMNLSYNDLRGKIPTTFSNLLQLESLDLSFNKLSGSIPPQMNELTFLGVFSVAHNNLSGAIPERKGQFMTFDESSYEGNPFLCGPPLPKSCSASILPNGSHTDGDNDDLVDIYVFWVSFVVSYTTVLLGIAVVLYINPYWRRAWFYYIGLISTNCYYFIEDNLHKLSINI